MKTLKYSNPIRTLIFILCSLSLIMMTTVRCNKTGRTTYYTVKFVSNGGSAVDSIRVASGSKVTKPTVPVRATYTFAGWYSDDQLTKVFDFNTVITGNITLYAKWTLAPVVTQLSTIITNGTIPNDLSGYDMVSQQVLSPYAAAAKLSAIYITVNGAGKQDGTSWENAKPRDSLKSSIDNISDASSNKVYLVLIGAGTYIPGASIRMKNNVGIIGSFPATGGWARNATDTTAISGDNKYIVIYNNIGGLDHTALLYGVKITESHTGYAGMYNTNSSPTVKNVIFENNGGVGMLNVNSSSPIVTNVAFNNNVGGMSNTNSSPIVTNVIFENNGDFGMDNQNSSSPIVTNVIFKNNREGMRNDKSSSPIVRNVIFSDNN